MKTRLFNMTWDNSKIPNLSHDERFGPRESEGVQFATGLVALAIGVTWDSMDSLVNGLGPYGTYTIIYQDGEVKTNAKNKTAKAS
jgi:hypothetical protein